MKAIEIEVGLKFKIYIYHRKIVIEGNGML